MEKAAPGDALAEGARKEPSSPEKVSLPETQTIFPFRKRREEENVHEAAARPKWLTSRNSFAVPSQELLRVSSRSAVRQATHLPSGIF